MKPNDNSDDKINDEQMSPTQQAAANILRSKIDDIYENNKNTDPYGKTHTTITPESDQLQQYHSAWQNYYNKYYEGYYSHKLNTNNKYFKDNNVKEKENSAIPEKENVEEIRDKLLNTVAESADKVRKSRHFKPLLAGFIVVLFFLLIQYNGLILSKVLAYVSPGSIDVQNIVIDPSSIIVVDPAPRLIIPKVNVDVPVLYDINNDYTTLMEAMDKGVAHFAVPGASSHPGQIGNTVLSGHSSSDLLTSGDYKFIFVQLEKLAVGDTIYVNYESKRYTYIITETKVVGPDDVDSLIYTTSKPILTLITCVPIGTAKNRLLVISEQVSPDPTDSIAAPTQDETAETKSIPGVRPTLIEWLLGKRD
jgi:sortase A